MEERRPLFPPITVLLCLRNGNPCHERQHYTTATERNRSLFVNMKKSKLEEGPQGCPCRRRQVQGRQSRVFSTGRHPGLGVALTHKVLDMFQHPGART